jgi:hypothetical protein
MLVGGPYSKEKVVRADELYQNAYIPKGGKLVQAQQIEGPTSAEARLLVAWQADGFSDNYKLATSAYSWEFKKERKRLRLRQLLDAVGADYYERKSKWQRFVVKRNSVPFLEKYMADKHWHWEHIFWSEDAREAIVDELRYWDGDSTVSAEYIKYLTASKENADIVAAMCTLSGRSSYVVRCDDGTYRTQSADRQWRNVNSTERVSYKGKVYCATVPSGFMVTRREGKVDVSGNSMAQIMRDLVIQDADRDPDIPSMREWGKNIEQIRRLVRGFRDLPINTIFTALAKTDKDTKTGTVTKKPYLSGKLADEVAAFLDVVVYYYVKNVKEGDEVVQKRLLLTGATDALVAKDRSGNLPMIIQGPTMQRLHDHIIAGKHETKPETKPEIEKVAST